MKQQMLEAEVKELNGRIEALTAELDARPGKEVMPDDVYLMSCLRTTDVCTLWEVERLCVAAADRIEALTAELVALKAQNEYQEKMIRQADVRGDYWRARTEKAEADADATEADNDRLKKGCECAMSEIRAYMQEVGSTLPLELAMGWLSAALNPRRIG